MTAGTERPTRWPVIPKDPATFRVAPNLADYDDVRKAFTRDESLAGGCGTEMGTGTGAP